MKKYPLVSVVTITYGHAGFILDTINGVISQKYDGPIEFIIANDKSPDNTDEVIERFIKTQNIPSNIKIFHYSHQENKGIMPNFTWALGQAKGKYIALCEGDDYWIDEYKLKKQIDFLEENQDYAIHSGRAEVLQGAEIIKTTGLGEVDTIFTEKDFLTKNNLVTCTATFLNIPIKADLFNNIAFGDWLLYLIILNHTKKKCLGSKDILATYRVQQGGAMQNYVNTEKFSIAHIHEIKTIRKISDIPFSKEDWQTLQNYYLNVYTVKIKNKQYKEAYKIVLQCMECLGINFSLKPFAKVLYYRKHIN